MKLVTFIHNGNTHIGVLQTRDGQQTVVSLNEQDPALPHDLIEFLAGGAAMRSRAEAALAKTSKVFNISEVTLKAPIPRPGKIMCVGLNYRDHAAEGGHEVPEYPTIFAKYNNCVIGPYDPIVIPRVTDQIDWEGEFGFVIGRRARYVPEEEALNYVAGYVCFNDVSARDYQMRTSQWTMGKTFDTFGPMGPALVTADEIPDPHNLSIRTLIGDEVVQNSNTRHLIFTVHQLVASLSEVMTLEPGDLVSTGTPAGVGVSRKPPRYLRPGQVVRVEIEGLGTLENPVIEER
jgi:2-keto-4-pentenoate hydratase/2-oxohepta-3-ene-1,7-dioic acid hydratase in catechol pathway